MRILVNQVRGISENGESAPNLEESQNSPEVSQDQAEKSVRPEPENRNQAPSDPYPSPENRDQGPGENMGTGPVFKVSMPPGSQRAGT